MPYPCKIYAENQRKMNAKKRLTLVRTSPPWKKELIYQTLNFLKMDKGFTKQKLLEIMRPVQKQDGLALLDLSAD